MRVAFVSALSGSSFMAEILSAIAGAAQEQKQDAIVIEHVGTIDEVDDGETAFVIVPHEYFALNPRPSAAALARTIAYGVEHPGTETFARELRTAAMTAARFELSAESVAALAAQGFTAEHFPLGYSPRWDRWGGTDHDRPTDLLFMGTVDPGRLRILARIAPDLVELRTELLIPPHEQMTRPRPDFLLGDAKRDLLGATKLLLNLHREDKTALEWVRVLEAMCNGCVVLSEPSSDLGRLEPGRHLLMAHPDRIGAAARAAAHEPERLRETAAEAYRFCQEQLNMSDGAARMIAVADDLVARARRQRSRPLSEGRAREEPLPELVPQQGRGGPDVEAWLPIALNLGALENSDDVPWPTPEPDAITRMRVAPPRSDEIDVICVDHPGSGPPALTATSLAIQGVPANLHLAAVGGGRSPALPGLVTYVHCPAGTPLGGARNAALGGGDAPFVLVVEAGDEVLPGALEAMVARLREDAALAVSFPIAANGSEGLLNVFVPEAWRLERHIYLTRGYLVRRDWFEQNGAYPEDSGLDALVDHDFWMRMSWHGGVSHLRSIGIRLWPTNSQAMAPADLGTLNARLGIGDRDRELVRDSESSASGWSRCRPPAETSSWGRCTA